MTTTRPNRTRKQVGLTLAALLLALAMPATAGVAAAAGEADDDACGFQAFPVRAELVAVDASPLAGKTLAYPVIRFVADLGDETPEWVVGSVAEWETPLEFTYDPVDGLWKTEPTVNPTPTQTLHGSFTARIGGGWFGYFLDSCGTYEPLVSA